MKRSSILLAIVVLIAAALSCNLPSATAHQQQVHHSIAKHCSGAHDISRLNLHTGCYLNSYNNSLDDTGRCQSDRTVMYDVDSSETASQHRAPYATRTISISLSGHSLKKI